MFELILQAIFNTVSSRIWLPDKAVLPSQCAICNKEVSNRPRRMQFGRRVNSTRFSLTLHLCSWHACRRWLVMLVSAVVFLFCVRVIPTLHDGQPPSTSQWVELCGTIISVLFFFNSILHDPYFRSLEFRKGQMAIKGFGSRFREALQPEEIVVPASPLGAESEKNG